MSDAESMSASIHLFEPKHFLFPFLAHALGTLCGAAVGHRVAGRYRLGISLVIGALFLAGGIAAAFMIPAPAWFIGLDLSIAYLPMAWLGSLVGRKLDLLIEKPGREIGQQVGRSPWLQPVIVDVKAGEIGDIVSVRITRAGRHSLHAAIDGDAGH